MTKENLQVLIFVILIILGLYAFSVWTQDETQENCYPDDLQGKSIYCE